jgi:6-phosphogluconolactonase (cycloisomerase 2 family)
MRIRHLLATLLAASFLNGCGGGSNGGQAGRLSLTVHWPQPSRLIPVASNSIKAVLTRGTTTLGTRTLVRPQEGTWVTTVTFEDLEAGPVALIATAFPNADGTGTAQATGSAPTTIIAEQTANVTVTMASTIATIEITPPNPTVVVGQTVQLTATPKDSAGNVVLVAPGNLQWNSATTANATVNASGLVTGVAAGTSQITAQETEAGVTSAPDTVTVTGNFSAISVEDPRFMTMTPDGQFLYINLIPSRSVAQFRINADGSLAPLSPATIGGLPGPLILDIQANPVNSMPFVYVSNPDSDKISEFQHNANGLLSDIPSGPANTSNGLQPAGMAIHPSGMFLYVADPVHSSQVVSPRISMFSIGVDGHLSPLVPDLAVNGFQINRLAASPDGKFVFSNNNTAGGGQALRTFQVNNDGTLTLLGEFGNFNNASALTVDPTSRFLYTATVSASGGTVTAYSIAADGSLTQVGAAPPAGSTTATALAVTPDGKYLYVPGAGDNKIFAFQVQADGSLTPLSPASVTTGNVPIDVEITPNGQFLYVTNRGSNSVWGFRINADGSLTRLF